MSALHHEECLSFVSEILSLLKSTNQHEKVLHLIVDRIVRMYKCRTCAVILVDPKTEYLNIANGHGVSLTFSNMFRRKLATGPIGQLLWTGRPIFIADSGLQPDIASEVKLESQFGSCLCVQISAEHRTLGYLHADSLQPNVFEEADIRILQTFADFAALALSKSQLFEENLRLDRIDHETGLDKYVAFLEQLHLSLERGISFGENFALLLLDVDNFKHIALTYGYDTSKKLLREIAGLVRSHVRSIDAAGRYGFDEIVIERSNTSFDEAVTLANELRLAVEEAEFTGQHIKTTVSIGVATYPENGGTLHTLLLSVKEALFEAQRTGRNRVFHFTPKEDPSSEKILNTSQS
ncbi:MAG: diguanylate cyclase [Bacteroidota bacterium]